MLNMLDIFRGVGVGRSPCTVLSSTQMDCPSPAIISAGNNTSGVHREGAMGAQPSVPCGSLKSIY